MGGNHRDPENSEAVYRFLFFGWWVLVGFCYVAIALTN